MRTNAKAHTEMSLFCHLPRHDTYAILQPDDPTFKSTTIAEFNPSGQIRYYNPSLIPSLLAMQSSFPSVPGSGATQVPPFHTDAPQNGVSLNTSAINSLAINDAPKDSDELLSHPYFIETV
jgi:hypothetical protein